MNIREKLSEANKAKFRATGDIRFALLALAAEHRLPTRKQYTVYPTTVEEFLLAISEIGETGGQIEDKFQKLLNRATAEFLVATLSQVKSDLSVFKTTLPKSPLSGLIPEVLPYDKDSLQAFATHLKSKDYPTPEIKQAIAELAADNTSLTNAITFVISLAFISTVKDHILKNPILTILPNNLLKLASQPKFAYRSPRLADLIDALKIVHGKFLIEYNQSALSDFMQASADHAVLYPSGSPPGLSKSLEHTPSHMAVLCAAYMRYYKDLYKSLQDYCWSNITDVNTKVISNSGEVLTPNVYLNPNVASLEGASTIATLTSKEQKLADLDLNMVLWNGERYKPASVGISSSDIRSKFIANRDFGDIATSILDDSAGSIARARAFMQGSSSSSTVQAIAKLMASPNIAIATAVYDEFIVSSKTSVEKILQSSEEVFLQASEQAKKTYGDPRSSGKFYGTDFKNKDVGEIRAANEEILFAFESAKSEILEKYGPQFKDLNTLGIILTSLFKIYAMPLMPITMRYVYNAASAMKLALPAPSSDNPVDTVNKTLGPQLVSVMTSPQFADRYVANEDDYKTNARNSDKLSQLKVEALGDKSGASSILEPILSYLGIDNAGIKLRQKDLALAYGGTTPDAMKKKREVINKTLSDIMSKYDDLVGQGVTGGVSREHVIIYICDKVLPGIIEEYVAESLLQKSGVKTTEQQEQISNFVRTNFMTLKSGRKGAQLASNTVYGKLSELYTSIDQMKAEGQTDDRTAILLDNPLGAIMRGASFGYMSSRTAPAMSMVQEVLRNNSKDPSVTDENWADPNNPRPRKWKELAELTGAFADPIPDMTERQVAVIKKKRINIQPGERLSKDEVARINSDREVKKLSKVVMGTVRGTIYNAVRRLGNDLAGNPVSAIRAMITARKREILSISPAYKDDILPYTVSGKVPWDHSPFISDTHIAPKVEVDFSVKPSENKAEEILDKADEPSQIDNILGEMTQKGVPPDTIAKMREALQKLPQSYLSEQNLPSTLDSILVQINPRLRSVLRGRKTPPSPKDKTSSRDIIQNLSKTIFSSGSLATRLLPSPGDDARKLNAKAEEMVGYLQQLSSATTELRREAPSHAADPQSLASLRQLMSMAKEYNTQLLKAINKAKVLAEKLLEKSEPTEFDYIQTTLVASREKLREFISRLSQMPGYKSKADVLRRVSTALESLVDPNQLSEAITPQSLQLLLLELTKRAGSGDSFDNLLLEVDKYRVKNSMPPQAAKPEGITEDVGAIFEEMGEKYESDISTDQFQTYTPTRGRGDS